MNKLSLFSGIGGDDLASDWAGIETVCFVEKDKYCQQVLRKHWPDIPIIEDVKDATKEKFMAYADRMREKRGQPEHGQGTRVEQGSEDDRNAESNRSHQVGEVPQRSATITGFKTKEYRRGIYPDGCGIGIISGGFPCQPHSVAGKRQGSGDERNLWPEFRRIIGEIKPRWVVAENVPGLFSSDSRRFFGEVLADLAALGYSVGWCTFGAVDVGALHRRDRVFIVAHSRCFSDNRGSSQCGGQESAGSCDWITRPSEHSCFVAVTAIKGLEGAKSERPIQTRGLPSQCDKAYRGEEYWQSEPDVGRVAHGVPHRVDRLKGLGNAVVPQQIYPVYKAIVEIDASHQEVS